MGNILGPRQRTHAISAFTLLELLVVLVLLLMVSLPVFGATVYVDLNSPSPTPPYTNWATAARVLQEAVNVSRAGDLVLVTNGVYAEGGQKMGDDVTNRVALKAGIKLHSVNGPDVTFIVGAPDPDTGGLGDNAVRAVYVGSARLVGFTITNGFTRTGFGDSAHFGPSGGGALVLGGVVSNCPARPTFRSPGKVSRVSSTLLNAPPNSPAKLNS